MLSDFLTLEAYFGYDQSALFFEDLVKRYSQRDIKRAVKNGDLRCKQICGGRNGGRFIFWLSRQGRKKAQDIQ